MPGHKLSLSPSHLISAKNKNKLGNVLKDNWIIPYTTAAAAVVVAAAAVVANSVGMREIMHHYRQTCLRQSGIST